LPTLSTDDTNIFVTSDDLSSLYARANNVLKDLYDCILDNGDAEQADYDIADYGRSGLFNISI